MVILGVAGQQIYKEDGYEVGPLNNQATTLGGEPAIVIDAFVTQSGVKLRFYEIVAKRSGVFYVLVTATNLPPDDPAALIKPITDTWQFL